MVQALLIGKASISRNITHINMCTDRDDEDRSAEDPLTEWINPWWLPDLFLGMTCKVFSKCLIIIGMKMRIFENDKYFFSLLYFRHLKIDQNRTKCLTAFRNETYFGSADESLQALFYMELRGP